MWSGWESNPHALRQGILSPSCIPVSPPDRNSNHNLANYRRLIKSRDLWYNIIIHYEKNKFTRFYFN